MKKVFKLIFIMVFTTTIALSLIACETKEEKEARKAKKHAEEVEERYNKMKEEHDDIRSILDRLN